MTRRHLEAEVVVVGGELAGVCATVAAVPGLSWFKIGRC